MTGRPRIFCSLVTVLLICFAGARATWTLPPNISGYIKPKEQQTDEQRLLYNLLRGYERSVRPVKNASTTVVVRLGITLTHLFDLDERNQVLTTMVWLDQEWYDELLTWDPKDYNGLSVLRAPCELLWLPDIVLYNNAEDYTSGYMRSKAMVSHTGNVFWPPPTKLRSTCRVDITFFPFDSQECIMKFGSWTYNGFQVDVTNRTAEVDLKNYVKNGEWELLRIDVQRNAKFYSCCPEPFVDVTFRIVIRRRVLYYTYNVVFPCIMMSTLTLLVFLLPPDSGEKIALGVTVLLAFSVFMLAIAEKLPETSDFIPLIGIYLTVVMTMTSISVVMTVFVLNFHWRAPEKFVVPRWIQKFILKQLAYLMCIETDFNRRSDRARTRKPSKNHAAAAQSQYSAVPGNAPSSTRNAHFNDELPSSGSANNLPMYSLNRLTYGQVVSEMRNALGGAIDDGFLRELVDANANNLQQKPVNNARPTAADRRQLYAASSVHMNSLPQMSNNTNHAGNHQSSTHRRRTRSSSKDRLQEEVIRALTMLISRHEQDENIMQVRKQWRQVAQVLDRCLFWIFFVATFVSTFALLVIMPMFGDKGITDPVEDRLNNTL